MVSKNSNVFYAMERDNNPIKDATQTVKRGNFALSQAKATKETEHSCLT